MHRADGSVVFTVAPNPEGVSNNDIFQLVLIDPAGERLATMDIIRSLGGWSFGQELVDTITGFGQAGGELPIPIRGSLVSFDREPTAIEGDLAVVVCVDICIGLRPYIESMD